MYARGDVVGTRTTLRNIFCKDDTGWHFPCSKLGCETKAIVAQLASGPFLLDDAAVKLKIREQIKFAGGGGGVGVRWVLYTHITRDYPNLEVIIIKGVADYGDEEKMGSGSSLLQWLPQTTHTFSYSAALHFINGLRQHL